MSEKYISVFAAIQAKPEYLNENHENKDSALYAKGWNACNNEYIDNLLDIPAADVRPVARGAWEREMRFRTCSKCGATTTDKDDEGEWIPDNFCPNCGAHMGDDSDAIAKD